MYIFACIHSYLLLKYSFVNTNQFHLCIKNARNSFTRYMMKNVMHRMNEWERERAHPPYHHDILRGGGVCQAVIYPSITIAFPARRGYIWKLFIEEEDAMGHINDCTCRWAHFRLVSEEIIAIFIFYVSKLTNIIFLEKLNIIIEFWKNS